MIKILNLAATLLLCVLASCAAHAGTSPIVTFNEAEFRDKVYACWLGKSIGGTLGMPFEGRRETHSLTFYDPVPDKPSANDDLDLQLLWLKAIEERGTRIDARILGEYWLKYVPVNWNEYGTGKANMRDGFLPPVSGHFRNEKWRNSNGAWIRSEIWACLAPGCPSLAVRYAWQDACVDHGTAEGTYAELFTAAVESAAFVEKDRDRLIEIGLSYIPARCGVAAAIRTAIAAKEQGLDLPAAREAVVKVSEPTGWFQAPRNVGFVILGWLYGGDDFGKAICDAVNCGDDTDCTGATLGSILGIIHGGKVIPEKWRGPVGETILNVAVSGFQGPATLSELTDRTIIAAKKVLNDNGMPVAIVPDSPTDLSRRSELRLTDPKVARGLWSRSPYRLVYEMGPARATFDYVKDPDLRPGEPRHVTLLLENLTPAALEAEVRWKTDAGLTADAEADSLTLMPGEQQRVTRTVTQSEVPGANRVMRGSVSVSVSPRGKSVEIPFAFLCHARNAGNP